MREDISARTATSGTGTCGGGGGMQRRKDPFCRPGVFCPSAQEASGALGLNAVGIRRFGALGIQGFRGFRIWNLKSFPTKWQRNLVITEGASAAGPDSDVISCCTGLGSRVARCADSVMRSVCRSCSEESWIVIYPIILYWIVLYWYIILYCAISTYSSIHNWLI